MKFSVIMPTVGRAPEVVATFLSSLDAQSHRDFELIVVDQNPDERLAPLLATYGARFPVLHVRSERKGAARARNTGLDRAGGDGILAFPDDDCRYPPDLLEKVTRFFAENPWIDGLSGRSVGENGEDSMGRFGVRPHPVDRVGVWGCSVEYAIFLRASSVPGARFDGELGTGAGTPWGAGEGTDFMLRVLERGASLYYDPSIVVVHPPLVPPYDERSVRKAYSYGRGMGHLLRQHKMPARLKAKWLYRPLGGAVLALAALKPVEAKYRWSTFRGRLRGLRGPGR